MGKVQKGGTPSPQPTKSDRLLRSHLKVEVNVLENDGYAAGKRSISTKSSHKNTVSSIKEESEVLENTIDEDATPSTSTKPVEMLVTDIKEEPVDMDDDEDSSRRNSWDGELIFGNYNGGDSLSSTSTDSEKTVLVPRGRIIASNDKMLTNGGEGEANASTLTTPAPVLITEIKEELVDSDDDSDSNLTQTKTWTKSTSAKSSGTSIRDEDKLYGNNDCGNSVSTRVRGNNLDKTKQVPRRKIGAAGADPKPATSTKSAKAKKPKRRSTRNKDKLLGNNIVRDPSSPSSMELDKAKSSIRRRTGNGKDGRLESGNKKATASSSRKSARVAICDIKQEPLETSDDTVVDESNPAKKAKKTREIRVGVEYQAVIPDVAEVKPKFDSNDEEKSISVWLPTDKLTNKEIDDFVTLAEANKYTEEQALGLLLWHRCDVQGAMEDLSTFAPRIEEWTFEEKALFHEGILLTERKFEDMTLLLPNKSIGSMVQYYYQYWKKLKYQRSRMDLPLRQLSQNSALGSEVNGIANLKLEDNSQEASATNDRPLDLSMNDKAKEPICSTANVQKPGSSSSTRCRNCSAWCAYFQTKDNLCNACVAYKNKEGGSRPLLGPIKKDGKIMSSVGSQKKVEAPPAGIYILPAELKVFVRSPSDALHLVTEQEQVLADETIALKSRIQGTKQTLEYLRRGLPKGGLNHLRPKDFMPAEQ